MGAREVRVTDGYGNRRVIVFDATTGAYKRRWGAYGNRTRLQALKGTLLALQEKQRGLNRVGQDFCVKILIVTFT